MPVITKDQRIQIVATSRQLATWRQRADQEGLTLSAWLRGAADVLAARETTTSHPDRHERERFAVGA
jgi:hypothetical protein